MFNQSQLEERAARLKEEVERAALSGLGQLGHAQYPAPKLADAGVLAGYSGMHLNSAVGRCGMMAAADVSAYVKWALCLQEKLELISVEYNGLLALLDRVQDDNKRLHEENLYLRSAMAPPSLEQLQQAGGLDPMMQVMGLCSAGMSVRAGGMSHTYGGLGPPYALGVNVDGSCAQQQQLHAQQQQQQQQHEQHAQRAHLQQAHQAAHLQAQLPLQAPVRAFPLSRGQQVEGRQLRTAVVVGHPQPQHSAAAALPACSRALDAVKGRKNAVPAGCGAAAPTVPAPAADQPLGGLAWPAAAAAEGAQPATAVPTVAAPAAAVQLRPPALDTGPAVRAGTAHGRGYAGGCSYLGLPDSIGAQGGAGKSGDEGGHGCFEPFSPNSQFDLSVILNTPNLRELASLLEQQPATAASAWLPEQRGGSQSVSPEIAHDAAEQNAAGSAKPPDAESKWKRAAAADGAPLQGPVHKYRRAAGKGSSLSGLPSV